MKYYFITGTSSGIGEGLVKELLGRKEVKIFGFARRDPGITNSGYSHFTLDLGNFNEVDTFKFPDLKDASEIILVNNAGTLGEVAHVGHQEGADISRTLMVNLTSVAILSNKFLSSYGERQCRKVIMNISSGAGKSAIDGWSIYCASKAGLDLYSKVIAEEQKFVKHPTHIFSIAPGIVDTEMQQKIRTSDKQEFSRINDFIQYKEQGELADPGLISQKLLRILDNPENFKETVFSVRDLN
jgi:benzil reductase ((S)-benzoin forming)